MNRRVLWDRRALADLAAIGRQDRRTAQRIMAATTAFAEQNIGDVRKLAGTTDEYRLRVGDWRVLFTFGEHGQTVDVSRVLNRRDAYR